MPEVDDAGQWRLNYFNYFTEIEEHFQKARGTSLFLLRPLDWALIESWKTSGVPLEAVLRGIDIAFEKWRQKKSRVQQVNSLAYCAQAVLQEAQAMADRGTGRRARDGAGTRRPVPHRRRPGAPGEGRGSAARRRWLLRRLPIRWPA